MEADIEFHRQLARMADTRLLFVVLEVFWKLRLRFPREYTPEMVRRSYERHLRLYQAIKQRDLQLARLYLAEHFAGSYQEMLAGIEQDRSGAGVHNDG